MSCPEPDRVLDYFAHRLASAERAAIEAHVDACSACRVLLVELAKSDEPIGAAASDPDRVGRYRIEARLGEGGMGTVYAAHDPQLDRRVAIKLVHGELAARGGADRLVREGRALAKLTHPNIVAVYDAGLDGDRVYIAMELVEGETLASWLAKPRPWRDVIDKFVAAGRGLAAAHAAGITHRDVKPENVLLDRAGVPKVADFGLADSPRTVDAGAPRTGERITRPGGVVGTPAFMSPEQKRGGEVGPATDQYSLCAAIASALEGEPRWVRRVLARGMASDPAARYPSLGALVDALDPVPRRRRTIATSIGGTLAIALGAGLVVAWPRGDQLASECAVASDERGALWSDADRTAVAGAMGATKLAFADETIRRTAAEIESYLASIAEAETALCVSSAKHDELLALRTIGVGCLATRRAGLAAMIARLRTAGPDETRSAIALVHGLANVEECANTGALAAELAIRAKPAAFVARIESQHALRRASEVYDAGRYRDAHALIVRAVERARVVGGVELIKALLARGEIGVFTEGFAAGEAAFREAVEIAEATHADELRALAMTNLMATRAREAGREREALAMRPLVEAAITRAGKRDPLLPLVHQAAGTA